MSTFPADNSAALPGRGIQPLDSLHNHARLVVLIFLIATLLGLPVVFTKGQPLYESAATVQVSPRYMKTLHDDIELEFQSNTQYLQFIQQQIRTLTRHDVLELALKQLDARYAGQPHPWRIEGESVRRSIYRLQRSVRAFHVRDSYLIQITLASPREAGIEDVVNTLVDAYLAVARNEHVYGADQRVAQLEQRQTDLLAQIEKLTNERTVIAQSLGVTAFKPAEVNPFDRQMQRLLEEQIDTRTGRIEAETRLAAFLAQGETDLAMRSISESILSDPGLNSLKASLNQRRANLLTTMSGLAEQHPARLDASDELVSIEAEISLREEALRAQLAQAIERRYRNTAEQARVIEQALARTIEEVREHGRDYAEGFNQALSLNNHIQLLWSELDRVRERLNFFEAEEASPGFLRLVTPALPPLHSTGIGRKKLLLILLVVAVALSVTAPILIDLFDSRIRTVNDVHRTLGFPPLGWIVDAIDRDRLRFAEDQLRRLASGLIRDANRHATRTIVITSVRPGGGTTWIARSLTRTLNRLGFPTLVVEANAYRPDSVYGPGPGLVSALESDSGRLCINATDPDIPSMPVGSSTGDRALENLHRLQSVLKAIPEHYRFVVVDAPPLLACSDAELVAGAGDAVLLVTEAAGVDRGELGRAGRLLRSIDPPVVGAVVNRINPFHGGGYVTALVEEHRSGRKVQPTSMAYALGSTAAELIRAPLAMAWNVLSFPFAAMRRRLDTPALAREER